MSWFRKTKTTLPFPTHDTLNSVLKEVIGSFEGKFPEVEYQIHEIFENASFEVKISWKSGDTRTVYKKEFAWSFFMKTGYQEQFLKEIYKDLEPELKVINYNIDFEKLIK